MPVDPSFAVSGPEWQIDRIGRLDAAGAEQVEGIEKSQGFGDMLGQKMAELQGLQNDAATQAQALATGQTEDATSVVMAVEKAKLSMQLATQLRERGVTALQEVLRTQV